MRDPKPPFRVLLSTLNAYWHRPAYRHAALLAAALLLLLPLVLLLARSGSVQYPLMEWSELNQLQCVKPAVWPKALCWPPAASLAWHVRQFEAWKVMAWSAGYGGIMPHNVISFPMEQIPMGVLTDKSEGAKWTTHAQATPDGRIHVVVDSFPCEKYGCCAVHWQLRPNSTDLISLFNNFVTFDFNSIVRLPISDPRFILDAGGNGMSAFIFALLFPRATVVRVEPHFDNYRMGMLNSFHMRNMIHINLALWSNITRIQLCDDPFQQKDAAWPFEGSRQLGFRTREGSDPPCAVDAGDVQSSTIQALMRLYGIPKFDIVKLDVEGAEGRLFGHEKTLNVIKKADIVYTKVHEKLLPGFGGKLLKKMKSFRRYRAFTEHGGYLFAKYEYFSC